MASFEYFYQRMAVGNLDIEDLGNCAIEANNDDGLFYYLLIETNLGFTKVFEYGPIQPDFHELPKSVKCTFDRIEYTEAKLSKIIQNFLNGGFKGITQAQIIDKDTLLDNCTDIIEYMRNKDNF